VVRPFPSQLCPGWERERLARSQEVHSFYAVFKVLYVNAKVEILIRVILMFPNIFTRLVEKT
jgi:hypothetical protein